MKKICCLFVILFVITTMGIAGAAEKKIIIKTPDKIIQTEDSITSSKRVKNVV